MEFFNDLRGNLIDRDRSEYIAFSEREKSVTFNEFYGDIVKYANFFSQNKTNRIAILGATSYKWICHAYGAMTVGKEVILIDPLLPRDNIISLLQYSDSEILYIDEEDHKLKKMVDEECNIDTILFYDAEEIVNSVCEIKDISEIYSGGDAIFFTSGTSGNAKGVVMGFDEMYRNAKRLAPYIAENIDGKAYMPLPLSHLYSNCMVMVYLIQGRELSLGTPKNVTTDLEIFKPAVLTIVPSIAEFILKSGDVGEYIRVMTVAGAKCEKSLEETAKKYGIFVQNIYGASEFAGVAAVNRTGYAIDQMLPVDDAKVFLENEDDLVVYLPDIMKEYYKNPEETSKVKKDGKIYLGDQGVINSDGSFQTLGRKQDMIAMKNGSKLYCLEIDDELSSIDGVKEACVIYANDKVIAVIVADETLEENIGKALKVYNKKQPYFRKIEEVWYKKNPLPRTSIGKLKRKNVQDEYLETHKEGE